jgi:hypothetical protein
MTTAASVAAATAGSLVREQFAIIETGQLELAAGDITADFVNHRAATEPPTARGQGRRAPGDSGMAAAAVLRGADAAGPAQVSQAAHAGDIAQQTQTLTKRAACPANRPVSNAFPRERPSRARPENASRARLQSSHLAVSRALAMRNQGLPSHRCQDAAVMERVSSRSAAGEQGFGARDLLSGAFGAVRPSVGRPDGCSNTHLRNDLHDAGHALQRCLCFCSPERSAAGSVAAARAPGARLRS